MRTVASEVETPEVGGSPRPQSRSVAARKSRLRRMALESLEPRTLMATLPAAMPGTPLDISNAGGNESNPWVAVDRYNPNKLVSVWVRNDQTIGGPTKILVQGAYSNDGGNIWTSFNAAPPVLTDPNSAANNRQPFADTVGPSVGFDSNNNFYVLVHESALDDSSGAIILEKFDFSGSAPSPVPFINPYTGNQQSYNVVYEWANNTDFVVLQTLAVDDNQLSFQDPATKKVQTDPYSNRVYVSWATNDNAPTNPGNFNPNTIRLLASDDGGQTFTTPTIINDNLHFGNQHDSAPRITISQGRLVDTTAYGVADPGVSGGQVTTVWDDFNSLNAANKDQIWSSRIQNSGASSVFAGTPGFIAKAFPGVNGSPDFPQTTVFTANVNITDPNFTTLSDLAATLNINTPSGLGELSAVLIAPDGTQVTLFTNQINSAGAVINGNIGLTGNNLGIATSGDQIGTTFDDSAARNVRDRTATGPYIGTFRPEFGSLTAAFRGMTAAQLSGTWTLQITDNRADGTNPSPSLGNWSLNFTSGMTDQRDIPVATTPIRGAFLGNLPLVVPSNPNGVGPEPVITSDNTLGSFSPHQGTLYVGYVTRDTATNNNVATNTDIALATSTDGGGSWQVQSSKVNDDRALTDGFSGSITLFDPLNSTNEERGQSQYMPAVTVDQATGTLVMSWRDARYDASNARVATMITTSIDGGQTFAPDVFANAPQTVTDAITGKTIIVGPIPDNQSSGNPATEATFGYGNRMGLAAFNGQVYPVWSGNQNVLTPNGPRLLDIFTNRMNIAAGPRVVASTMGPVGGPNDTLNTQTAADGTPVPTSIAVTFDRPIDPTVDKNKTFLPSDVEVFFNGTTTAGVQNPVSLLVTSVKPVPTANDINNNGHFGYTQWLITFDPTRNANGTARTTPIDFTGTYSYLIKPEITDKVRSLQLGSMAEPVINQAAVAPDVPQPIPAAGTGGSGTSSDTIDSFITLNGHPNQIITGVMANLSLSHTRDGDLTITLISPNGTSVTLYHNPGDNGQNFVNTTFSDTLPDGTPAPSILFGSAPYTGTFQPGDATTFSNTLLASMNGGVVDGVWDLRITDSVPGNVGQLNSWSLTINSSAPSAAPVVNPGNLMDQNADGTPGQDPTQPANPAIPRFGPFTGLTPGDVYAAPAPAPVGPTLFNLAPGSPTGLFPQGPYSLDTLPLIVPGPHVVTTSVSSPGAVVGATDNLVLNNTVKGINLTFDRDINPASFTPDKVLQIMGPAGRVDGPQTFNLPASAQNQPITGTAPLFSTLQVLNDNNTFPVGSLAVQVNITYPVTSDLTGYLIAPNGNKLLLFSGVGFGPNSANFTNTTFSDSAGNAITNGTAPFTGTFRPQGGTLTALIHPNGPTNPPLDLQGNWQLQIVDASKKNVGTLNSWSLIATPQLTVTPKGDGKVSGSQTFTIGFPQQQLSGTYTVQVAPTIVSTSGDQVDSNLNAGLDVLRGQGLANNTPTIPVTYPASNLPQRIPGATGFGGQTNPGVLQSTINVPDNFLIQGDANGVSGVTVQLNITHPHDSDLEVTLVYHLGQPDQVTVPLFANVGNGPNQANFQNTVFDDLSQTPIQSGGAPFFGSYNPTQPLNALQGLRAGGLWTLIVKDDKATPAGSAPTLNSWSLTLQKPLPVSGLGEPVTDNISTSFRIFTMDPTNPLASDTWTAVGPASIGGGGGGGPESSAGGRSGRVGGIAVDPSDPSGNTVFVGGASGGVWKTTNFLNPGGPTWIPLTDFGPTFSLNVGSIAVYPRNNDPRQSIVIVATGEGDIGSQGVGFIRSMDGGTTWTLLDSTTNADALGNLLPISSPSRDHVFVGNTSFKVVVDPKPTASGGVIIYAAMSGAQGGIWRSIDTGNTWQKMRAGQATDVLLDPASGTGGPNGSLQILYAAFRGEGVFLSPNRGQVFNLMTGGVGNPLIVSGFTNVNPASSPNPNGAQGRIELAKPFLTGNPNQDQIYEGWLYAAVIGPDSHFHGLYLTKDYGQNWTQVRIPTLPPVGNGVGRFPQAVPTTDITQADYDIGGGPPGTGLPAQGNYDVSLAIDPTNPNIVYLGGTADGQTTGFLRIDSTFLFDAHNAVNTESILADGGALNQAAGQQSPLTPKDRTKSTGLLNFGPYPNSYINLIRDPAQPFVANATLDFSNGANFLNNGAGVKWIPFDIGGTDQHRIQTVVDPLTGHARIIIGDDQGIFTAVDNNGMFETGIGTAQLATGSRNGNLQITQFYYGAAQPSNLAAQAAGALFYGSAQDNGGPSSDPNVLNDGNITWGGPGGDAGGVATDQQGGLVNSNTHLQNPANLYQFWWPCCGGNYTNFFQVNGVGRTFGLLQQSNGLPTPDPQWPSTFGANFAVNPLNGQQVIISSAVGRIFSTESQGRTWQEVGNPAALDSTYAEALAYGAPDPNGPGGIGNLDSFFYAGTTGGHIFLTQTGGGAANNAFANISTGLDLSPVQRIITNPTRGSHEAYAVTAAGVYHITDSVRLANALTANAATPANPPFTAAQITALGWQNISGTNAGSLFALMHNSFGDPNLAEAQLKNGGGYTSLPNGGLTSIVADWRYVLPLDPTRPAGPSNPTHPVLYVGGGSGVYRSLDNGATWAVFPNVSFNNAPQNGGLLPNTQVSDLGIILGNIDVNTGRAIQQPGDPNVLLATTYGRGQFAIRLGPVVTPTSVQLDTTLPAPKGSNAGIAPNGGPLVTVPNPVFDGFSEQSAFGNTVRITLLDITDPNNPRYVGGYDGTPGDATDIAANQTDAFGHFVVQVNSGAFTSNGVKTIGVQATDASGTKGNVVPFSFTLMTAGGGQSTPPTTPTLVLRAADDSSHGQNVTNVSQPHFDGTTSAGVQVALLRADGTVVPVIDPNTGQTVLSITSDPNTGAFSLQPAAPLNGNPPTQYSFRARATNANGSTTSPFVTFTERTIGPATNTFNGLAPADDTGIVGDNITANRRPHFIGTTDPNAQVDLLRVNPDNSTTLLTTVTADGSGAYSIQLPLDLTNGTITLETQAHDAGGNFGPTSATKTVTIASVLGDYNGDAQAELALYRRGNGGPAIWLINKGVTPAAGVPFGAGGTDIPLVGDFNGDGINDLAYYRPSTSTFTVQYSAGGQLQGGNVQSIPLGQAGDIPVVANFDGTGLSELAVFEPSTGTWIISGANGVQSYQFGQAGDIPVPNNYDGTGRDELALYRPSTGQFLIAGPTSTTTLAPNGVTKVVGNPESVIVGVPNEIPAPAGYDNSFYFNSTPQVAQRTEPAVYNPNTGQLTIYKFSVPLSSSMQTINGVTYPSPNGVPYNVQFQSGDIIASADYDGTGNAEPAVFRPSTGQFIVNGPTGTVNFGQAGDIPVLAPYFYRQLTNVTTAPSIALNPADDSGVVGDNITNVTRPRITGKADPGAQISLIDTGTGNVIGNGFADTNGNYSVAPTNPLADGTYQLQTKASGLNGVGLTSSILSVTIETNLRILSVSPPDHTFNTGLPNGQVVVTFNHPLAGLTADDPSGNGFANNPYAVFIEPAGPAGLFVPTSGYDAGSVPLHGTLVYHVNPDGTSQISLTPTVPLGTDLYLISVANLTDLAGNPVPAGFFTTTLIKPSPNDTTAPRVTSVSAYDGTVGVGNNTIPQPDTIGIAFSKPMDTRSINTGSVHLFLVTPQGNVPLDAAVAYSPTTHTAYLTPQTVLNPGSLYLVGVDGSVTDDQGYVGPGDTLGSPYYTTFMVSGGPAGGQSPLRVLATNPADHTAVSQPIGYAAVQFSEAVDRNSLGRYSVQLIPNPGAPNNYVPLNDRLAFNPNTNQVIIVPTVPLGNNTIYVYSLSNLNAVAPSHDPLLNANGQVAGVNGPPVFDSFLLQASGLRAFSISQGSQTGHDFVTSASPPSASSISATVASPAGPAPATAPSPTTGQPPVVRIRPAQATAKAHDHVLAGASHEFQTLLSARRRALNSGVAHHLAGGRGRKV